MNPIVDSLQEGQNIDFAVDIRNISDYEMDSLLVRYWIEDQNRVRHYLAYPRQDSLHVNKSLRDTVHFSTVRLRGYELPVGGNKLPPDPT